MRVTAIYEEDNSRLAFRSMSNVVNPKFKMAVVEISISGKVIFFSAVAKGRRVNNLAKFGTHCINKQESSQLEFTRYRTVSSRFEVTVVET